MNNKTYVFVFSFLFFFTFVTFPAYVLASTANITQINFTSVPQTIDINAASSQLTTQTQNTGGGLEQLDTSGTILELSSSSATGQFSSNATNWIPVSTLGMNNGTANRNFYYKDSTAGTHTLTVTVQGKSWVAAVQNITINPPLDTTAPTITLTGANPQTIEVGGTYTELGATVSDNVDTGLTATIGTSALNLAVLGNYSVTYDAIDFASNPAIRVTRLVNVVDTTKPVITLTGSSTINSIVGDTYTEQSATVSDNYDTGLTVTIGGDSVDTTAIGTYTITYNAVDSSGNTADQITRTVVYGPIVRRRAFFGPPVQNAGSINPTVASEPAQNTPAAVNTEISPASAPATTDTVPPVSETIPAANSVPIPENTAVIALNIETTSKVETKIQKVLAKAEDIPPQNDEPEELNPEALTASAINALPIETSSNKIPIILGTLSGVLLLASIWKLKFIG